MQGAYEDPEMSLGRQKRFRGLSQLEESASSCREGPQQEARACAFCLGGGGEGSYADMGGFPKI